MLGHGHKARNYVLGMQNNYQNDLVGCGGHRKVKGQSQEGQVKGSLQEEEGLGATEKQTKCVMHHFAGTGPEWASISSCVHGQHDTAILATPATQINVRMSTLFPFLNYRGTGANEAWKVLRAHMTNLGQMGSQVSIQEHRQSTQVHISGKPENSHKADGQMVENTIKAQVPWFIRK